MSTPIDHDQIELLARGVMGQLSPLTGTRGTGTVTVTNETADELLVPKNLYLLPVVGSDAGAGLGELRDDLVFKTRPDATTLEAHGVDGNWRLPPNGSAEIGIWSNLGGARHNLPAGTLFRWDPSIDGIADTVTLNAAITDAADKPDEPRIARLVYYEELDGTTIERDLQNARLNALPAAMIVWQQSAPAEGRTSGTNQGSTRAADGLRVMTEYFNLYVIVGDHSSDKRRRGGGLRVLQAATLLLTDVMQTRDYEFLASMGSLEVLARKRYSRSERHYVYSVSFRLNRILSRVEEREPIPWLKTHIVASAPGDSSQPDPMVRVDVLDPNPPGP